MASLKSDAAMSELWAAVARSNGKDAAACRAFFHAAAASAHHGSDTDDSALALGHCAIQSELEEIAMMLRSPSPNLPLAVMVSMFLCSCLPVWRELAGSSAAPALMEPLMEMYAVQSICDCSARTAISFTVGIVQSQQVNDQSLQRA